jgi:hypothetical protein
LEVDVERGAKATAQKLGDAALKKAHAMKADGTLTRAYADSIAELITPSEYDSLLTWLTRGSVSHNNRDALATSQRLMYTDAHAAERFIHASYKRGELMDGTYTAELSRAHSLQREGGPKTEYEMSRSYIVTSLDPGPYVRDPAGKARFGEALDAYDRWNKAGTRTDEDIHKRGREIVDQYRFINLSETIASLPSPRSGRIRRAPADMEGMNTDIANAIREADRRRAAKTLTPEEHANEMGIIERWIKAMGELNRGK